MNLGSAVGDKCEGTAPNGGVASVSVVPTGLWVCGAPIPSDDEDS